MGIKEKVEAEYEKGKAEVESDGLTKELKQAGSEAKKNMKQAGSEVKKDLKKAKAEVKKRIN